MRRNQTKLKRDTYPGTSLSLPGLASCAFVVTIVSVSVHAHEEITDALLTDRFASCAQYVDTYSAEVTDVQNNRDFSASLAVSVNGTSCEIASNAVPNHDFNATGSFATPVAARVQSYTVPANPAFATSPTALSLRIDNAVFLNGVKLDLVAAGCFGVGDGRIGCSDMSTPYRYDPMSPGAGFGADEHNAHTQPDGTYHYHGNPVALFEQDNPVAPSPVVGFAADGFPVFGSFISDGGTLRKATSSYRLKSGTRGGGPGGAYDGTFVDDWEYVAGSGDLDRCNGMVQDGVYGYVVTETYPHVLACFMGTVDSSFLKGPGSGVVTPVGPAVDVKVAVSVSQPTAAPADTGIVFTVTAENTDASTASTNVRVGYILPPETALDATGLTCPAGSTEFSLFDYSGCEFESIGPGASVSYTVSVAANQ